MFLFLNESLKRKRLRRWTCLLCCFSKMSEGVEKTKVKWTLFLFCVSLTNKLISVNKQYTNRNGRSLIHNTKVKQIRSL